MRHVIEAVLLFLVLVGLYIFFAGEVSTVEIVAGVIDAVIATSLAVALVRITTRPFWLQPPLRAVLRPVAAIIPEFLVVGRELLVVAIKGAPGQRGDFVHQPFEFGGNDATSAGRRALTVIGVSLAPRSFVIRGENDKSLLLHTLPRKQPSRDTAWPA